MIAPQPAVLVVDDEIRSQEALRRTLEDEFDVRTASGAEEALSELEREPASVVICDQRMPGMSGVEMLKQVRERWPDTVRIVLSGYTDTGDIIAGINEAGIWQYVLKPWQPEALVLTVRRAAELHRLQREHQRLNLELRASEPVVARRVDSVRATVRRTYHFDRLLRADPSPLDEVCRVASRVAPYDIPVLVTGDSGTGKELLARAIHHASTRASQSFVVQNCGALPDQLLESELFGTKRGAFTGAYEDRIGLFQQANGGTIFLDEIGETSPAFQVKLLRVLQDGEIRPLGTARSVSVDVRLVSATNKNLQALVEAGRFREDLYYRLSTVTLSLPPLRDRPEDVPVLARAILARASQALGKAVTDFSPSALACMQSYGWPGNVRELQNEIYRMVALADGPALDVDLLAARILEAGGGVRTIGPDAKLRERVEALEANLLREVLARHRGNKSRAADELGLSRVGLRAKLARYGLEDRREQ
jgi:two-component system response regulator HupR/HoxA